MPGGSGVIKTPISGKKWERKMQLDKKFIRQIIAPLQAILRREYGKTISVRHRHAIVNDAAQTIFEDHANFTEYLWDKLALAPCLTSI